MTKIKNIINVNNKISKVGKIYKFQITGNKKSMEFYKFLYKNATVWLERKKAIFDNHWKMIGVEV